MRVGNTRWRIPRIRVEKLFAGNDAGEQDRHCLAVLSAAAQYGDECAAVDEIAASGGDGEVASAAKGSGAVHASRPSWAVNFMSGVTLTNSGEMAYSGSPA